VDHISLGVPGWDFALSNSVLYRQASEKNWYREGQKT